MAPMAEWWQGWWPPVEEAIRSNDLVFAAAILAVSFVAAKIIDFLITRTIVAWSSRTRSTVDDKVVAELHGPIVKTVMLLGLAYMAQQLLPPPTFDEEGALVSGAARPITVGAVKTLCLLIWTVFALRISAIMLHSASLQPDRFRHIEQRTFPLFDNAAKLGILALAIWGLLTIWDVDAAAWLASAGIVGLALGFAAKDTLSNLFAGIFIIADSPYQLGDYVVLDTGERGMVNFIGLRSTRLLTRDDIEITIPNSVMGAAKITNETRGPTRKERIRVKVGVAYGSDIGAVRKALLDVAAAEELVCDDPEPRVRFRVFGESSLDFELLGWISEPVFRGRALDVLNTAVYERFAADGIQIPFPQRDVHIKEVPSGWGGPAAPGPSETPPGR